MIDLPIRYLLLGTNPSENSFIFEMKIIPIADQLNLNILIYKLKAILSQQLYNTIENTGMSKEYFDKLPKELLNFSYILSQSQAENLLFLFQKILNDPTNNNKPFINVNCNPIINLNLWLTLKQVFALHTFFGQFITNYTYYRTEYFKNPETVIQSSQPKQIIQQPQELNRPIVSISRVENLPNTQTQPDIITNDLLTDFKLDNWLQFIFNQSEHPILTHFIAKYINLQISTQQIEEEFSFNFSDQNKLLIINILPLIPHDVLILSNKYYSDLNQISLLLSKLPKQIINRKLLLIFDALVKISNHYLQDPDKKNKFEIHLIIQVLDMMFFIYLIQLKVDYYNYTITNPLYRISTKTNNYELKLDFNLIKSLNFLVNQFLTKGMAGNTYKKAFPFQNIQINHLINGTFINQIEQTKKELLNKVINNNKYLLHSQNIDGFITSTYDDFINNSAVIDNPKQKDQIKLLYNSPHIIDINHILKEENNNVETLLSYKLINTETDELLKHHIVITKEYLDFLRIQYKKSNININNISQIISKYFNILINIINDLKEPNNPLNTLNLFNELDKYLKVETSIYTKLQLIFRVIIPLIYDRYKINNVINFFN